MKKVLIVLFLLFFGVMAHSQNEIHLAGSDSIIPFAKIKLFKRNLSYSTWEKPDVFMPVSLKGVDYVYVGGKIKGTSNKELIKIKKDLFLTEESRRGAIDACHYYRNYKDAGTAVFISTIMFGAAGGLLPALGTSSVVPQKINLDIPESLYKDNINYIESYTTQAHRIKKNRVWRNYGSGIVVLGISVAVIEFIYVSTHKHYF